MIVYPAIDLKKGRCVRLFQGDPEKETVYSEDPLEIALKWRSKGVEWIHVVDLDGAFSGKPIHKELIVKMAKALNIPIQVGGGIRREEDIDFYLSSGVSRVIIGTRAFYDLEWFRKVCKEYPGKIALGIDTREGFISVKGWREVTSIEIFDFLKFLGDIPLGAIIFTDISRDGTHRGVNIAETERVLRVSPWPVIASGGVSSMEDIRALCNLAHKGLDGVIIGKALYDGRLDLEEVINLVKKERKD